MITETKPAHTLQKPVESKTGSSGNVSIAVVIPNYNHAALLPIALESVVTQSRQPDEIYIYDDASTDNSVEVARRICERHPNVRLVLREKNLGVCGNMNDFVMQARTDFILPLAADDYLLPGYIEGAHALLCQHPTAGICTANTISLMPDGSQKISDLNWSPEPAFLSPKQLTRVARGDCTGQCFYQTKALQKIGGFEPSLRWHTDHFTGWVVAARHGACYLTTPGEMFRKSETSYCATGARSREHQNVMLSAFEYLRRPDFADVKPVIRDAHVLSIFDKGLFWALCRDSRNHYFLTPSFLWMLTWRQIRLRVRHPLPEPIKWWIRKRFNFKKR